jgi:flagella basal body P-ring formation protein FlgA
MRALILALMLIGHSEIRASEPAEAEIAVRRGDRVQLFCRIGAVTAQVEAEALQDGRTGAEIRVRNLQNGRVHRGRITAPGTVEVLP